MLKNCLTYIWLLPNWLRRRQWHPTPALLPGKSHGWRSLVGCSPWGLKELDTTERLHFHFSLSCFGEGNVKPLQCSCLENPRDGGAWWAAVYGVAQSRTRLKRLSSSSSSSIYCQIQDEKISLYEFCAKFKYLLVQFSSVTQSCPTLRPHESQHARLPCPSPTPGVHSDSHPSSQ